MSRLSVADDEGAWEEIALRGSIDDVLAAEASARAAGRAGWAACLRMRRSMFERHWAPAPRPSGAGDDDPRAAALTCALGVRAAVLTLDPIGVAAWCDRIEAVRDDASLVGTTRLWRDLALGRADATTIATSADELERAARETRRAALVVDAATIGAMGSLVAGDVTGGLARARRASRMAGTEGIAPFTVLAHVVLARARRLTGHPHLAGHVATLVGQRLSVPCRLWPTWERILGTGTSGPPPPDGAPERLYAALEAAGRGDRGDWEEALDEIGAAPLPAFLRAEVDALRELADWSAPSTRCAEWIGGTTDAPPFALDGASGTTRARAFVLAAPGRAPRRVLALGRSLCERETHAQTIGAEAEQARTDSTVAALLLAGPEGVPVETLFERIYGFPHHERHDGVWRVLLHRVRARVEGWATLEHAQRHVSVVPRGPVLFPDARCERADAEVLAYAAAHGVLVAKDIAEALGVPLRRAQDALKRLAEGGLFRATSEGRVVRYVLEDTTFGEPTPTPIA